MTGAAPLFNEAVAALPGTFVDPELREKVSDLLFEVKAGERKVLLYLLFEHQPASTIP